jgi:hypothetical protein
MAPDNNQTEPLNPGAASRPSPAPGQPPTEPAHAPVNHCPASAYAPTECPPAGTPETEPSHASAPPAQVPGYKLLKKLGAGTYGVVWLAEEEKTGIRAAIKFFYHGTGEEWQLVQAEVKQLAMLHKDPGIVELLDAGLDARPPYYVMRYAEGGSLAQRLERGPLPLREALAVFRQVAEALAYVHVKGIRHCDLKPGNVLLDARGRALVADFGQAHLSTDASPSLGTFFYMAPEQANLARQIPDTRWDVFGLGALFYAMLTGKAPREDSTLRSELQNTVHLATRLALYRGQLGRAPRPVGHRKVAGMDNDLAALIDACLAVDPERRPRDAGEVLAWLARRERRRQQLPVLVSAVFAPLFLVLLLSGVLWFAFQGAHADVEQAESEHARRVGRHNQFIAELVADDVRGKVDGRIRRLEDWARDPALAELLAKAPHGASPDVQAWLLGRFDVLGPRGVHEHGGQDVWDYMSVVDADGYIVALIGSKPGDRPAIKPTDFRYRDWFHGQDERPPGYAGVMVKHTYVSEPYFSTLGMLMFTVVTPVRDAAGKQVGLLTMSLTVERIARWFNELNRRDIFAVLLNQRGRYLYYPEPSKIQPPAVPGAPTTSRVASMRPVAVHDLPMHADLFQRRRSSMLDQPFTDPLNGKHFLASYAPVDPVGRVPWGVVIQMEHEIKPAAVQKLESTLWRAVLATVAVLGLGLPILWGWLLVRLRRQEATARS